MRKNINFAVDKNLVFLVFNKIVGQYLKTVNECIFDISPVYGRYFTNLTGKLTSLFFHLFCPSPYAGQIDLCAEN